MQGAPTSRLTQQELGGHADVNYKFVGEIERGLQNPSFNILNKIAEALGVELLELFRFEQEISDRNEIEIRINKILKTIPDDAIRQVLLLFWPKSTKLVEYTVG